MDQTRSAQGRSLAAVILITRSRPGPRLVFTYPAEVDLTRTTCYHRPDGSDSESETDEKVLETTNEALTSEFKTDAGQRFLGLSVETLEKLLSPGRWSDGKKFEVSVNGITFIGHPVYASEDGRWIPDQRDAAGKLQRKEIPNLTRMTSHPDPIYSIPANLPESFESRLGVSMATSADSESTTSGIVLDQMNMFHVVFAMRTDHEHVQDEVFALYHDVLRRLSRALEYCQKQYNYVAVESRKLAALRAKANNSKFPNKDVWPQISEASELGWALQQLFLQISRGGVATVRLCGNEISLHVQDRILEDISSGKLCPHSAILLLEPREIILADLSHPESSHLSRFVREHMPTKSLLKQANNLSMPITDVLYLAHHLIKWRKARIISPLHRRNTYIIHPNAPLQNLHSLNEKYAQQFPSHLPSLTNMLKVLGGRPVRYGQIPPSRDHRAIYMEILAFLVRERLVKQIVTYGWLQIPMTFESHYAMEHVSDPRRPVSATSLLSPHLRANGEEDESASVTSERTALPSALPAGTHPTSASPKTSKRLSIATQIADSDLAGGQSEERSAIGIIEFVSILNPTKPSDKESDLIAKVRRSLDKLEHREVFASTLPYLDGEHPIEDIAARIGLKRAQVDECIAELQARNVFAKVMVLPEEE